MCLLPLHTSVSMSHVQLYICLSSYIYRLCQKNMIFFVNMLNLTHPVYNLYVSFLYMYGIKFHLETILSTYSYIYMQFLFIPLPTFFWIYLFSASGIHPSTDIRLPHDDFFLLLLFSFSYSYFKMGIWVRKLLLKAFDNYRVHVYDLN